MVQPRRVDALQEERDDDKDGAKEEVRSKEGQALARRPPLCLAKGACRLTHDEALQDGRDGYGNAQRQDGKVVEKAVEADNVAKEEQLWPCVQKGTVRWADVLKEGRSAGGGGARRTCSIFWGT